jgi:DNA-binding YbaB/EbfC family protein
MVNMQKLMKQAQKRQEQLQLELAAMEFTGSAGGEMVSVTVSGSKEIKAIGINPEVVDPEDVEMLQDLVLAAIREAMRLADEAVGEKLGGLTGGMKIPGLNM